MNRRNSIAFLGILFLGLTLNSGMAGELSFSDPAHSIQPPAGAIGFPERSPELDITSAFQNPPMGYGNVPFYWWLGDPLDPERLRWQIAQLAGKGTMGLQVNYAHSDSGGLIYGHTYPSSPALFTDAWWALFKQFQQDAAAESMSVSLSDYTLGIGQGSFMDKALQNNPDIRGAHLESQTREVAPGQSLEWKLESLPLSLRAYPVLEGQLSGPDCVDLSGNIQEGILQWKPDSFLEIPWKVIAVWGRSVPNTIDPMNPATGPEIIKVFFQEFENHLPGQSGKGLNFFFSDELDFRIRGNLWNKYFADEFRTRKGYDLLPWLPALFEDIGPQTPKIRLDYRDVMVSLSEEGYFKPVYDWHTQRGMLYGCDHGGRGKDITEFGDYFRTQRWMSGPGCDQPQLNEDLIKNKIAASISHLYQRPRVWLEGFHSSGWGTSSADITRATLVNFIQGHNLLSLHGLYYSTHGGYWEWAPPDNHFRMPYWQLMGSFMDCVERMGYLLSQGTHSCQAAVLYPVAAYEAGLDGDAAKNSAFDAGTKLYRHGYDFDFMDFESLARASVSEKQLSVSGETYSLLVLPSMRAVRFSTLEKALEFYKSGGIVAITGSLPEASDRIGRQDPQIQEILTEIFGASIFSEAQRKNPITHRGESGGLGLFAPDAQALTAMLRTHLQPDVSIPGSDTLSDQVSFVHRKVGKRDIYCIYGAEQASQYLFRSHGNVELWNPWDGTTQSLTTTQRLEEGTLITMPLSPSQAQILVFSPEPSEPKNSPTLVQYRKTIQTLKLEGEWGFELKPVLDNRWGDFHWPPTRPESGSTLVGPEVRTFSYLLAADEKDPAWREPGFDANEWTSERYGYGPQFWKLGPLTEHEATTELDAKILKSTQPSPKRGFFAKGRTFYWEAYDFSWKSGLLDDPGHQGYHGLKEQVHDDLIALGKEVRHHKHTTRENEGQGSLYYLRSTVRSESDGEVWLRIGSYAPEFLWINGESIPVSAKRVFLKKGINSVLLKYNGVGKGYVVFESISGDKSAPSGTPSSTAKIHDPSVPFQMETLWYNQSGVLPYDCMESEQPRGFYRFKAPPGLKAIHLTCIGKPQVWVDGKAVPATLLEESGTSRNASLYEIALPSASKGESSVALELEHLSGVYGGNAIPEPIRLICEEGVTLLGDWSQQEVLHNYSGGAWYRKTFTLEKIPGKSVLLNLGKVACCAEVYCNGKRVGNRLAPPYEFELASFVKEGDNQLEVLVYNTAANHWSTLPTNYRGKLDSGLIGPVSIDFKE